MYYKNIRIPSSYLQYSIYLQKNKTLSGKSYYHHRSQDEFGTGKYRAYYSHG